MNPGTIGMMVAVAGGALAIGWWLGWLSVAGTLRAELAARKQSAEDLAGRNRKQEEELATLRGQMTNLDREIIRSQTQLEEVQRSLSSERDLLTKAKEELTNTFKTLAADTLKSNNEQFLGLANRQLDAKQQAIDTLLQPMKETLGKLNQQTQELEVKREGAYSAVLAEVKNIQQTHHDLRQETTQLVQALRAPKARGNWGELQLKRCIEFAGMVEHCSFHTEVFMRGAGEDPSQRPDVVVQLPNGRDIVIDAKTPAIAYLAAMEATDETERMAQLHAHALQVKAHLQQLSSKHYWQRFSNSPDFVVCFLPSEVLFSAALEQAPDLIEYGSAANVILATPTTLIALLKAVAYGWQQMEVTKNAIAIRDVAASLYDKLAKAQDHFSKLGNALTSSIKHYNNLVGTVEGRGGIFSQSRKLHELGVGAGEVPEVAEIEAPVRPLLGEDWSAGEAKF